MYNYVSNKQLISRMRSYWGDIMQDLCHTVKEDYDIGAMFYLVGSGKRNMIFLNGNEQHIDLDYNLEIVRTDDWNDCEYIKECVRKSFNKVLRKYGLEDCQDSTSCLTTKNSYFMKGNSIKFSMDVAIVYEDANGYIYRLIHEKKCMIDRGRYHWNKAPQSKNINAKVHYIKHYGKWELVREQYKRIKNRYLTQNDHNHPSFVCYIEAVNNVYNSRKDWK